MNLAEALARRDLDWIVPDWPAPPNVRALMTTRNAADRESGVRRGMNLGRATGEHAVDVDRSRSLLREVTGIEPLWLSQVHGAAALIVDDAEPLVEADAAIATRPGRAAAVRVADCLPVLFCARDGTRVAAAHAGWRGLNAGVLEATIARMDTRSGVIAWLGPAIGPHAFEVGDDVRDAFIASDRAAAAAFVPIAECPGKHLADLYALARMRLAGAGVDAVYGGDYCTHTDAARFFSYRRDKSMERMAALIWLDPNP